MRGFSMIRWGLGFLFLFYCTVLRAEENPIQAHIYIDLASIPTLAQMTDVVRQPVGDPKLIIWKRIKALPPEAPVLKRINAQMIDATYLGEQKYELFSDLVTEKVQAFYQEFPGAVFHIHLNASHVERSGRVFEIIPDSQIAALHLYEDALGRGLWDRRMQTVFEKLGQHGRVIFYLGFWDPDILSVPKEAVRLLSFPKLAAGLSDEQRQAVAELAGLDLTEMQQIFSKRPVAVFVDDPNLKSAEADRFLAQIMADPKVRRYTWIYKNHPRSSSPRKAVGLFQKYGVEPIVLNNKIPLETLMVAGYTPDYVAGYGSSVFYAFGRDQILGYIRRKKLENYEGPLLKQGILTPDLVYDLNLASPPDPQPVTN